MYPGLPSRVEREIRQLYFRKIVKASKPAPPMEEIQKNQKRKNEEEKMETDEKSKS